jgi:antitoxin (DNA-binding transcriptional repressor) of toxin-antitoxin stability system
MPQEPPPAPGHSIPLAESQRNRRCPVDEKWLRSHHDEVTVGTKDLKNRLSHYLRRVRAGEVVRVTDRGQVVAEIRAAGRSRSKEDLALAELEASGVLTLGSGNFARFPGVRLRGVRASRAVLADRG